MRYIKEQLLTSTRYCEVYRAESPLGETVALKVTCPDEERPPHCSRDEIKLLKKLNETEKSQHVIQLLDTFLREPGEVALVFPFYPFTLLPLLRHYATKERVNPYTSIMDPSIISSKPRTWKSQLTGSAGCDIVRGLASGLAFVHSHGIIHRDIKPENIMFKDYDTSCPVIIDLGISYSYPNNFGKENSSEKICDVSTSIYKAPELIFRLQDYSYELDIWSLGIVMTLIFSDNLKPVFDSSDIVDIRLVSLIFQTFGTPTLESWPDAKSSRTFSDWVAHSTSYPVRDPAEYMPRAPPIILDIFRKMMVYQSSDRLSANDIAKLLEVENATESSS